VLQIRFNHTHLCSVFLTHIVMCARTQAVAHSAETSSATASGAQLATAVAGSYESNGYYERLDKISETVIRYGGAVYKLNSVDSQLERAWFQPLTWLQPFMSL
jgi:hypothetical protein